MKKKIIVLTEFFDPSHGGVERRVFETYKRIDKTKYDVTIYSTNFPKEEIEGVKYIKISDYTLDKPPNRSTWKALKFVGKAIKIVDANQDAIIDLNGHLAMFAGSLITHNNLYATLHDIYDDEWPLMTTSKMSSFLGKRMEKIICSRPFKKLIVVNKALKEKLISKYKQEEKNVNIIGNGIDMEYINSIKPAKKIRGKKEFVFVGRLAPQKNVVDILVACEVLVNNPSKSKNFVVHIIGDGQHKQKLLIGIKCMGLQDNIIVHGALPNEEALSIVKKCDALIAPSLRESFGIMLLEAMGCGTVPITYINDGPITFINSRVNGILIGNKSTTTLADCMKLVIDNELPNMKKGMKETAEAYDWDNIVKQIEKVYEEK